MLKFVSRMCAVIITASLLLTPSVAVFADTLDVTASVEAPLPPDLPVITTPNNSVVAGPEVVVTGTCIVVDPSLIVVLLRAGETIGSGRCTSKGTFSITIPLVLGVNIINVKFMTITGASGGFGMPLTIVYTPPISKTPTPTPTPTPSTGGSLALGFDYNFVTYSSSQETPVTIHVSGGVPPYTVFIGWGDGSSKTIHLDKPDTFVVTHLYRNGSESSSKIVIKIQDSSGEVTQTERALVTYEKTPGLAQKIPTKTSNYRLFAFWSFAAVVSLLAVTLSYKHHFLPYTSRDRLSNKPKSIRVAAKKRSKK